MTELNIKTFGNNHCCLAGIELKVQGGFNRGIVAYLTKEECVWYPGDVSIGLTDLDYAHKIADAKNPTELMQLNAPQGSKVNIYVENVSGEDPRGLLHRLYSGLTTSGEEPDFNRVAE